MEEKEISVDNELSVFAFDFGSKANDLAIAVYKSEQCNYMINYVSQLPSSYNRSNPARVNAENGVIEIGKDLILKVNDPVWTSFLVVWMAMLYKYQKRDEGNNSYMKADTITLKYFLEKGYELKRFTDNMFGVFASKDNDLNRRRCDAILNFINTKQ